MGELKKVFAWRYTLYVVVRGFRLYGFRESVEDENVR